MPGTRARRARPSGRDEALGRRWVGRLDEGASVDQVAADIQALPTDEATSGLRALSDISSPKATELLAVIAKTAPRPVAESAIETLGEIRDVTAAEALEELANTVADKAIQKAARRSIFRLASQGIRAEPQAPVAATVVGVRPSTLYRCIGSAYDGSGARSLWFGAELPLGGIYLISVMLHDLDGLTDCLGRDTTRKRFTEQEATMRGSDVTAWVELPIEYGKQLVQEGVLRTRERGHLVSPGYAPWADLIGNPEEPFSQALVYKELSGFEARMHPTLESETPRLFAQPEVESWFFPPPEVKKWLDVLAESSSTSRLLVTPETDAERLERILRDVVKDLLPARVRAGLKRRLEETAYIFLRTDREADARRAVQAAATIEEDRPLRPPHPFLRTLIERSLRIALEVERSAFEPARLARVP